MNKFYTIALGAMLATQASAQEMKMYDDVSFSKFSRNGEWLVENLQGTMNILQRSTGKQYSCADNTGNTLYMPGLGNSVSNNGRIVGTEGDYAAYWEDGNWTELPQATGIGTLYNSANAITPDESRIVGILGNDGASMGSDDMLMAYPVVWTKNASGEYECKTLPYPKTDFLGKTPQYVTAMDISDDGKTVVGQVRDFSGFYTMPIIYTEDANGNWSYRVIGSDEIYDKDKIGNLPAEPTSPTMPDPTSYMTSSDIDNYNAALEDYNEQMELYYEGIISDPPVYPMYADYMSDADQKAAYNAAVEKYNNDIQQYMADYQKYMEERGKVINECGFMQNTLCLTSDGHFLGTALEDRTAAGGDDMWGGGSKNYMGYFDLTQENPAFVRTTDGGDYLLTGMLNDGTQFVASPAKEYTRNTFVVKPDAAHTSISFKEYLEGRDANVAKWVVDHNSYDVYTYDYDDNWDLIITGETKDSLVTGTVMASPDGRIIVSYYTDTFSNVDASYTESYFIDFEGTTDGIAAVADDKHKLAVRAEGNTIVAAEGVKLDVYAADGTLAASAEGKARVSAKGLYVVRATAADGQTTTLKVAVK